jgi:signal transduction histidine kinase
MRAPRGSVRVRITLLASLVVATALAIGALALLAVLRESLERNTDDAARARAHDVAALAAANALTSPLTATGDDGVVQVVDAHGTVVAATANARRRPITSFLPGGSAPVVRIVSGVPDGQERERYRVWMLRARSADGPVTVYVGTSLETVPETIATMRRALLLGLPPLLALLAVGTWLLVGRALRPVESIRARVADISDRALDRRVPEPAVDDEIGRLARTMNAMLDRLESSSRRQRSFVGDASHELQSPLAAFRAQLEVALAHPETTDWVTTARDLLDDSDRMERLVRDLLFLARDDTASPDPPGDLVDLDDVVLEEATRLRAHAAAGIDTSRVSAAPVRGSRDELTRMVRNLLENADRYAASVVRVEVGLDGGQAELVVEDDGPGVPAQAQERIFDRFVRIDDNRSRETGGTGLGLAIVRAIAERHHGTVLLDDGASATASGARFVVRLPVRNTLGT